MATKLRAVVTGDDHLEALSDDAISCKGDRHDFPKLKVGPLPKNVRASHVRQGVYQLTYTCPDCGTVRTRTTQKGGIVDSSIKYDYKHPKGYLAPKGAGLTRADYVEELGRRAAPFVKASAQAGQAATPVRKSRARTRT